MANIAAVKRRIAERVLAQQRLGYVPTEDERRQVEWYNQVFKRNASQEAVRSSEVIINQREEALRYPKKSVGGGMGTSGKSVPKPIQPTTKQYEEAERFKFTPEEQMKRYGYVLTDVTKGLTEQQKQKAKSMTEEAQRREFGKIVYSQPKFESSVISSGKAYTKISPDLAKKLGGQEGIDKLIDERNRRQALEKKEWEDKQRTSILNKFFTEIESTNASQKIKDAIKNTREYSGGAIPLFTSKEDYAKNREIILQTAEINELLKKYPKNANNTYIIPEEESAYIIGRINSFNELQKDIDEGNYGYKSRTQAAKDIFNRQVKQAEKLNKDIGKFKPLGIISLNDIKETSAGGLEWGKSKVTKLKVKFKGKPGTFKGQIKGALSLTESGLDVSKGVVEFVGENPLAVPLIYAGGKGLNKITSKVIQKLPKTEGMINLAGIGMGATAVGVSAVEIAAQETKQKKGELAGKLGLIGATFYSTSNPQLRKILKEIDKEAPPTLKGEEFSLKKKTTLEGMSDVEFYDFTMNNIEFTKPPLKPKKYAIPKQAKESRFRMNIEGIQQLKKKGYEGKPTQLYEVEEALPLVTILGSEGKEQIRKVTKLTKLKDTNRQKKKSININNFIPIEDIKLKIVPKESSFILSETDKIISIGTELASGESFKKIYAKPPFKQKPIKELQESIVSLEEASRPAYLESDIRYTKPEVGIFSREQPKGIKRLNQKDFILNFPDGTQYSFKKAKLPNIKETIYIISSTTPKGITKGRVIKGDKVLEKFKFKSEKDIGFGEPIKILDTEQDTSKVNYLKRKGVEVEVSRLIRLGKDKKKFIPKGQAISEVKKEITINTIKPKRVIKMKDLVEEIDISTGKKQTYPRETFILDEDINYKLVKHPVKFEQELGMITKGISGGKEIILNQPANARVIQKMFPTKKFKIEFLDSKKLLKEKLQKAPISAQEKQFRTNLKNIMNTRKGTKLTKTQKQFRILKIKKDILKERIKLRAKELLKSKKQKIKERLDMEEDIKYRSNFEKEINSYRQFQKGRNKILDNLDRLDNVYGGRGQGATTTETEQLHTQRMPIISLNQIPSSLKMASPSMITSQIKQAVPMIIPLTRLKIETTQVQRATQKATQRTQQRQVQRSIQRITQKQTQRQVQRQVQKITQKQTQRQVQKQVQKQTQKQIQKQVQKQIQKQVQKQIIPVRRLPIPTPKTIIPPLIRFNRKINIRKKPQKIKNIKRKFIYMSDIRSRIYGFKATRKERRKLTRVGKIYTGAELRKTLR